MFYKNSENLRNILGHYLAIFSEGHEPHVPFINNMDGSLNVKKTLELACYKDFPNIEKQKWLHYGA